MTITPDRVRVDLETEAVVRQLAPLLKRSESSSPEHFVQFYESEAFLISALSEFIGAGLGSGDTCIVVATKQHRESLDERLKANGLDLANSHLQSRYITLDAAEVLSKFMVDELPEPGRFAEVVGGIVARAAESGHRVRIFGEMVALLWAEGNRAAAIQLEDLWNDLARAHPFSLFCAYPMQDFGGELYTAGFTEICHQHTRAIPAESYIELEDPDERLRVISLLQQKAGSLEVEVEQRKRAEHALLHLAAIVESSDDAILSKDLDGIITSWNAGAERIYGYSADEIVGRPVTQLFLPDRKDEFTQIMARIHRGERIDHFETTRVRKDGTHLLVSVTVSPMKNSAGVIIGASAIARDITAQRQLEAKFRRLFESNLIGVFISDFAGTFLDANNAFLDLLGYTRAELLEGSIDRDALTPPELHYLSQNAVKAMQEAGASGVYEKEYVHKSGKRMPVLVAVTRIEQTDTCIGFVLDISERKEMDRRKDEFISMASHELKTPVTSLKGFLALLQRRLASQEDGRSLYYLTRMDNQVEKLTNLIGDLLDLSKMQTGQLTYRVERFDVDALVQEIVEDVQETAQTHRLLIVGDLIPTGNGLRPSCAQPVGKVEGQAGVEVFGDRDRVGQVLINLLNNAIKYSSRADRVLVRVVKDGQNVSVSVQDFGIGIATEHQGKIFERFYQVTDPEEKTYPGLGIGLYICCEIIKRHGGQLWVESVKGEGSTFHFTLPLLQK